MKKSAPHPIRADYAAIEALKTILRILEPLPKESQKRILAMLDAFYLNSQANDLDGRPAGLIPTAKPKGQ